MILDRERSMYSTPERSRRRRGPVRLVFWTADDVIDSSYERTSGLGERRGSVPVVSSPNLDDNIVMDTPSTAMEPPSTPSRIASFFSKRVKSNLKRTKSVTKLDRKRAPYTNDLEGLLINNRMRSSRSHESLLMSPSSMHSIDLSGPDVEIKPLHSSMLGQEHCFQVSTANGSKYYSCRTAEERQKWIQHLRKTVQPKQEQTQRTDNSLKLWVLEAKNVQTKKKYFCELCLDDTLYARTSSKQKGDMLFWGEHFDFSNLPQVEKVTVNIYKEADKKKKKEKNVLLGYVNIPVSEISVRHYVEKWYTLSSPVVGKAGKEVRGELPQIRIKARYQTVNILPMDFYTDLIKYVETDYSILVEVLEPLIGVKAKEELAMCLVNILHKSNHAKDFLSDIVMAEVDKLENDNLAFRGNSIATKAMEAYLKLVGDKYLSDTLGDFVKTILESGDDCEVDPTKVSNNAALQRHQKNLIMYCEMAWFKIINSHCFFPVELKEVFASFRELCEERKRHDVADNIISACIFLRFLCPAILSPSLFSLTQEFPQEQGARNLTLIAKVVQSLANFTKFGAKEEFMTFLNDFVEREMDSMKNFLQHISTVQPQENRLEFDGFIDLGRELSVLHAVLVESLDKVNDATNSKLAGLNSILSAITHAMEQPVGANAVTDIPRIYDNLMQVQNDQNANNSDMPALVKEYDAPKDNVMTSSVRSYGSQRTVRGFDNPHRNGSITSVSLSSRELNMTEDYVLFTSVESSPPDHLQDDRLAPSQSTPSMKRPDEKIINQSWDKIVSAAEMVNGVNGEYVDIISFMDEEHGGSRQNSSSEMDNGDQMSIGQLSTVASSGYQSFAGGYSQSSSPVESIQTDSSVSVSSQAPLSFANPLFGHLNNGSSSKAPNTSHNTSHSSASPSTSRHMCQSPSSSSLSDVTDTDSLRNSTRVKPSSQYSTKGNLPPAQSASSTSQKPPTGGSTQQRHPSSSSTSSNESLRSAHAHPQLSASSPHMSRSQPRMCSPSHHQPPLTSQLSKSAEFMQHQQSMGSPHAGGMKRTVTDTIISAGCSPSTVDTGLYSYSSLSGRGRSPAMGNTVRMGVRSMQRKMQEQEKTKSEYEQELILLRQQLGETQKMLAETQTRLFADESDRESIMVQLQNKLGEPDTQRIGDQSDSKEANMKDIISRSLSKLLSTEDELRREQHELQHVVSEKQNIIETQERRIYSLDAANNRLLGALNQLKERYHVNNSQPNGHIATSKLALQPLENGQYKSSNC